MKRILLLLLAIPCLFTSLSLLSCQVSNFEQEYTHLQNQVDRTEQILPKETEAKENGTKKTSLKLLENEHLTILNVTPFSNGVAFITYKTVYEMSPRPFISISSIAIDTKGNVLFEISGNEDSYTHYQNEMMIVGDCVYDKKGKIIASPEISGYDKLITDNTYEFLLAYKKEESFSGETHYVGVLNNKGEWIVPLSSTHPILRAFEEGGYNVRLVESPYFTGSRYKGNNTYEIVLSEWPKHYCYYNLSTNELTSGYDHFEYVSNKGVCEIDENGNSKVIIPSSNYYGSFYVLDNAIFYNKLDQPNQGYYLYDFTGNLIADYSTYKISKPLSYYNGYMLCFVKNPSNAEYIALFDPEGNLAFEPIKREFSGLFNNISTFSYHFLNEYGFAITSEDKYTFYDYSGNIIAEYENSGTNKTYLEDEKQDLILFHDNLFLTTWSKKGVPRGDNTYRFLDHEFKEVINVEYVVLSHMYK